MTLEQIFYIMKTKLVDCEYLVRSKYCREYNLAILDPERKLTEKEYTEVKAALLAK